METEKFGEVSNMIRSIDVALKSASHVNDLITSANTIINGAFIVHMSQASVSNPELYKHMYEWGRVGDPNAKLWRHKLRGAGAQRVTTFEFKASQKSVPISDEKKAVGVKSNHAFIWKAPILELGLPVRIRPRIAKVLVMDPKWADGLIFTSRIVNISRQGDPRAWNAFTKEYTKWYTSGIPETLIRNILGPRTQSGIRKVISTAIGKMRSTKSGVKEMKITPAGIDKSFIATLEKAWHTDYISVAKNRRVDGDE